MKLIALKLSDLCLNCIKGSFFFVSMLADFSAATLSRSSSPLDRTPNRWLRILKTFADVLYAKKKLLARYLYM